MWVEVSKFKDILPCNDYKLKKSIRRIGLVEPIMVVREDNYFHVVSGNKRLSSAVSLGYSKVPAIEVHLTEEMVGIVQMELEELQREPCIQEETLELVERVAKYYNAAKSQGIRQGLYKGFSASRQTGELYGL
ncbi:MAG: ParB N-terminal domain-containing protein, partial [Lachnospiraceae bacterium]|nr:ParB N-terminal domain-containing protein [Lachnospiraceae bacterium]